MRSFEVTTQHLKLIRRLNWHEVSTHFAQIPAINNAHALGNQDPYEDVVNILELTDPAFVEQYIEENKKDIKHLIIDLSTCLEILTENLAISPGLYVKEQGINEIWRLQ